MRVGGWNKERREGGGCEKNLKNNKRGDVY